MITPIDVQIQYLTCCSNIDQNKWDELMQGTTKANGKVIRSLIKKHLPEFDDVLCFDFRNPYIGQCRKKKGLLVYVHSAIEYFFTY